MGTWGQIRGRSGSGHAIGTTCNCIPPSERGDQELSNDIKFVKIGLLLRKLTRQEKKRNEPTENLNQKRNGNRETI